LIRRSQRDEGDSVKRGVCRLSVLVVSLGATLLLAAPALAVQLDRSFGQGGLVHLSAEVAPDVVEYTDQFAVARDGGIYLLRDRYPCTPRGRRCAQSVSLARLRPNGKPDPKFGGNGQLELPEVQGEWPALASDSRGGALIGFHQGGGPLTVLRVGANGAVDRSFGAGGSVSLPCVCEDAEARILPLRSGRLLVVVLSSGRGPGKRQYFGTVAVHRLGPQGQIDRSYGVDGLATALIDNAGQPSDATPLPGGALVFFGAGGYHGGGPWVGRIGTDGGFDRRALRRTRAAMHTVLGGEKAEPFVGGVAPRPSGRLDLLGGRGARGFILRVRPDGRIERRFGRAGLKRLARPVVSMAVAPSGRSFLLSPRLEREGWYAEYGVFSAWVDRRGRILEGFGAGGRRLRYASAFGQLALQGGKPLLLDPGYPDVGCRSYCPPSPVLYRLDSR
jgi:hypothetical protein